MSGVIIQDQRFKMFDLLMREIRNGLVPEDKLDKFEEFHAAELYGGYGVFECIAQQKRFAAIEQLLDLLAEEGAAVVYGAVDITKTKRAIYGSADPLDIAFRICIQEIYEWVKKQIFSGNERDDDEKVERWMGTLVLLIVDDCEKKHKDMLQNSFRNLRHPPPSISRSMPASQRFVHFHDDVFFGDSRYSVGIQLADLCSYFIARHLQGDEEIRPFYDLIEPHIVYGQLYPEEEAFRTPQPVLKNLTQLGGLLGDGERISEIQPSDGGDPSRQSESSKRSNGSGEAGER
jgi:hypothetical protein